MNLIENAEQDKEDSGSSHKMMIGDTMLVSDDCYTKACGKRLLFIDQSQGVPAMRERVIKVNCTKKGK